MNQLLVSECKENLRLIGRTYEDNKDETIYFNWTCSGIEFEFTGNCLHANLYAYSAIEFDGMPPNAPKREVWPWIAVFLDEETEPMKRIELNKEKETWPIFTSETVETHKIKIIKSSENAKGKVGIQAFQMEGTLNLVPEVKKDTKYIEFIGDSITCGFGNGTTERDRFFYSEEENGWMSHAAIAARLLQADYSIMSVSGITVGDGIGDIKWPITSMAKLYPYTDRVFEEFLNKDGKFTEWDFKKRIPDCIVINLGTNDGTLISFESDKEKGESNFENNYYDFIKNIRDLNGPKPFIICALGSMDYYLYSNILKAVESYSWKEHDTNIECYKYGKIKFQEGYGAAGHPSAMTQIRMGKEIAEQIKKHWG